MKINISDKKSFVNKFLTPLNKINENAVLRRAKDNPKRLTSLTSTNDGTLILYSVYNCSDDLDPVTLNIPELGKYIKVLNCIDDNSIQIKFDKNCLIYNSDNINFKYHLLEDGILTAPPVSIEKIKSLDFNVNFTLNYSDVLNLLKGSTFTTDTNKIYFTYENGCIYGELTDKQKHNVDIFKQKICDSVTGTLDNPLPLNFEVIRMLAGVRFETVKVFINVENNVFLFDISDENYKLNYIASGYTG